MTSQTFVRAVEKRLDSIERKTSTLRKHAIRVGSSVQSDVEHVLAELPEMRLSVRRKLERIRESAEDAGRETRREILSTCRRLRDDLEHAMHSLT
ncbi:MAG: hypothetical protein H6833_07445 [Planctomycetes bacterium]|nr:hypothetical protein [Planctomycetota bacterium]